MGRAALKEVQPPEPPGDGGNHTGLLGALNAILDVLVSVFGLGRSNLTIFTVSLTTGGTFQRISPNHYRVKSALIQHIGPTTTEAVTLVTIQNGVAAQGTILNPPSVSGQAGGSLPVGNVDLYDLFFVRTSSGLTLSVKVED